MAKTSYPIVVKAFIAGSAFPVLIWPFLYMGIPALIYSQDVIRLETLPFILPFGYGFANILFVGFEKLLPIKSEKARLYLGGALIGLVFSLIGNFVGNIPEELFRLEGTAQYLTIPTAMILYAFVWRFITGHINKMMRI